MSLDELQPLVRESPHRTVAPAWHTAVVLLVMFSFSLAGARARSVTPLSATHGRAAGYVLAMTFEWVTVAFIWYGVRRYGVRIRDLIGGSWARPVAVLRDAGIAVGFLIISGLILNGIRHLLKAVPNQAIRNLFPHTPTEVALYLVLALSAGICEEIIFRGYLQRQFAALTRVAAGRIVLQGIAFGASHGYQGWKYMVIIAVFGILFGLLALWRRSLRPGMLAHFVQDGLGALLVRPSFSKLIECIGIPAMRAFGTG
jgi:uncharacterized protein